MIYLIVLQDNEECFIPINCKRVLDTSFFEFFLKLTKNKNVLYTYQFYRLSNSILINRNNIIFFNNFREHKIPSIDGGIITSNINDIINFYHNKQQDIYVLISSQSFCNLLIEYADYLIIYETTNDCNIKYLTPIIDIISFDKFNFLTKTINKIESIYYFVKNDNIF